MHNVDYIEELEALRDKQAAQITALKARIAELEAAIMRAVKTWGTYPLDIGIRKTMADLQKLVKGGR